MTAGKKRKRETVRRPTSEPRSAEAILADLRLEQEDDEEPEADEP